MGRSYKVMPYGPAHDKHPTATSLASVGAGHAREG